MYIEFVDKQNESFHWTELVRYNHILRDGRFPDDDEGIISSVGGYKHGKYTIKWYPALGKNEYEEQHGYTEAQLERLCPKKLTGYKRNLENPKGTQNWFVFNNIEKLERSRTKKIKELEEQLKVKDREIELNTTK